MFLTYLSLGVVQGLAVIAGLTTLNTPSCLIVLSGDQTVVKGCEHVGNLADVITALNNRLSFNKL
uniref:Movement protein TGBp3 n=1 Tax=Cactus virus X TaxID=112227 RepID=A0A0A0WB07_9VIRU|nr:triple gene block protein 3 [Cactus virus X]UVC58629.1 triple gene block 3 protein [Cactus virus X]